MNHNTVSAIQSALTGGQALSLRCRSLPHHDRVLRAGHELPDDGRARNLTGDQQSAGGLRVGEQERLLLIDGRQVDMRARPSRGCAAYPR